MERAFAKTGTGRVLRLVNDGGAESPAVLRFGNVGVGAGVEQERARRVARANAESAALSADDARWVFAQRVRESLDGGRAAILAPRKRQELVGEAIRGGMRPFDANLVIAIVQDEVRSGSGKQPGALGMVRRPEPVGMKAMVAVVGVTVVMAIGIVGLLIAWIAG